MPTKTAVFLTLVSITIPVPQCLAAPVPGMGRSWRTVLEQNANTLTYSFDLAGGLQTEDGTSVSLDDLFSDIPEWRDIVSSALQDWGGAPGITFTEVADSGTAFGAPGASGDIRLAGHPLSGAWAHAYYPMDSVATEATSNQSFYGDIHYNTEPEWDSARLFSTTLHEAGHSLGLGHNLDPNSVMFALGTDSVGITRLSDRDLTDFRALYFAVNAPAETLVNPVIKTERDWFSAATGTVEQHATVTVAGKVVTSGEQKTAIKGTGNLLADSGYGFSYVDLLLKSGASLVTGGDNAYGIATGSANALIINGHIATSGISSDGIALLGGDNMVFASSASTIQTGGAGANGIFSGSSATAGRNTILADGHIETRGDGAAGIYLAGDSDITLNGSITTLGLYAVGIGSDHYGNQRTVINPAATISTTGIHGYGVLTRGDNNSVIMSGSITTSGDNGVGIRGFAAYGNSVRIDGDISTSGISAHSVFMHGGENQVVNAGHIDTQGVDALGILLSGDNYRLAHYGSVVTSGESARGIMLDGSSNQAVSAGNLVTSGMLADAVFIAGSDNTWHSSGLVVTQGNSSHGVLLYGDANSVSNTGRLTTAGYGSVGIFIDGDENIAEHAGSIITVGATADGVYLSGESNMVANRGQIQAMGDFANGVLARGGQNLIGNTGRIEASGRGAYGIIANGPGNRVQLSGTVASQLAAAISVGGKWSTDTNSVTQTTDTGNVLLINGSAKIMGDILNDGAADGASVLFGAALDDNFPSGYASTGLDMDYTGQFRGNAWIGDVLAGQLSLNGASNGFSLLTVHDGATLGGNTMLAGNLVNNGRVAPGNSIGAVSVTGDYVQGAGAVLDMEIGGSQADLLAVSGNVTFDAGSLLSLTPIAPVLGGDFSLVTVAGSLSGSPLPVFSNSATLDYSLLNNSSGFGLHVDRTAYAAFATTANQRSVASVLDDNVATASGNAADVLLAIDGFSKSRDVEQALSALVPGSYTALPDAGFVGMRRFVSALPSASDILVVRDPRYSASRQSARAPKTAAYDTAEEATGENSLGYGQTLLFQTHRRDGATGPGYRVRGSGIVAGSDRRINDGLVGAAFSYQRAKIDHDENPSSSDLETWMAALRSAVHKDRWLFQGVLGYGYQRESSRRAIATAGFSREATSRSHGEIFYTSLEGRYLMGNESLALNPFAGVDYAAYSRSGTKEKGDGTLSTEIDRIDANSTHISAGVELAAQFDLTPSLSLDAFAKVGMRREFGDDSYGYTARMMGGDISVRGKEFDRSSRFVTIGLQTGMADKAKGTLNLQYDRQGDDYGLAAKAEVSIPF